VTSRFPFLDGLRGLAALVVVLHHGTIVADWPRAADAIAEQR
jgi:peptidoglycan/LPS O-acetylase OafA/YrhL